MSRGPTVFQRIWKDYKKYGNVKSCFHHQQDECSFIINAHSLQKNRVLSQIEAPINGNNVIYSLEEWNLSEDESQIISLKPIGKHKASTFSGFCDHHDKIFSEIEDKKITLSQVQLFLFTYRAFAHSYHQVAEQVKFFEHAYNRVRQNPENFVMVWSWTQMMPQVSYYQHVLFKLKNYKRKLDEILATSSFDKLNYYYRVLNYTPLCSGQLLAPVYTYKDIPLNRAEELSYLILNVIPDYDRTIVLLSHFESDYKGKIYLDELKTLTDDQFTEAISSQLIFCGMNVFFSPKLWDVLPDELQKALCDEITYCGNLGHLHEKFFLSKIDFFKLSSTLS